MCLRCLVQNWIWRSPYPWLPVWLIQPYYRLRRPLQLRKEWIFLIPLIQLWFQLKAKITQTQTFGGSLSLRRKINGNIWYLNIKSNFTGDFWKEKKQREEDDITTPSNEMLVLSVTSFVIQTKFLYFSIHLLSFITIWLLTHKNINAKYKSALCIVAFFL
jgi:hypothetical protein